MVSSISSAGTVGSRAYPSFIQPNDRLRSIFTNAFSFKTSGTRDFSVNFDGNWTPLLAGGLFGAGGVAALYASYLQSESPVLPNTQSPINSGAASLPLKAEPTVVHRGSITTVNVGRNINFNPVVNGGTFNMVIGDRNTITNNH